MLEAARHILAAAERITCFSGAGLSAPSGVGTFRDPVGGWWTKHDPMRLASPQGFEEDPDLVMDWYAARRSQIGAADPNPAHRILAARGDIVQVEVNHRLNVFGYLHLADLDERYADAANVGMLDLVADLRAGCTDQVDVGGVE